MTKFAKIIHSFIKNFVPLWRTFRFLLTTFRSNRDFTMESLANSTELFWLELGMEKLVFVSILPLIFRTFSGGLRIECIMIDKLDVDFIKRRGFGIAIKPLGSRSPKAHLNLAGTDGLNRRFEKISFKKLRQSWFPESDISINIFGPFKPGDTDEIPFRTQTVENLEEIEKNFGHFRSRVEEKWIKGKVFYQAKFLKALKIYFRDLVSHFYIPGSFPGEKYECNRLLTKISSEILRPNFLFEKYILVIFLPG